ncbi:MAG: hypothetical protein K2P81_00530 [Bacteriovoracaceae bacterium]|nr:hypothetical protein [Bacteriovoracaceae bacterium]
MLKEAFKDTLKHFMPVFWDVLISVGTTTLFQVLKGENIVLTPKLICLIAAGVILLHFINHVYKNFRKMKELKDISDKKIENEIKQMTIEFGRKFVSILGNETRTTVFVEQEVGDKLFLRIISRFNSYREDQNDTTWQLDRNSHMGCVGIAGRAWSKNEPVSRPRLLGKNKLNQLVRSEDENSIKALNDELRDLNMSKEELVQRLSEPDRKFKFPMSMYAKPGTLRNGRKFVIAIDNDNNNTSFRTNFISDVCSFTDCLKHTMNLNE